MTESAAVPEEVILEMEAEASLRSVNSRFAYDYPTALYAIAATRATILQVYAPLSVVTVFVTNMARYPVMVLSPFLELNLPRMMPNLNPWPAARAWMQLHLDCVVELAGGT